MTPSLYPLATPTPQDLNQPDFSFSFLWFFFPFSPVLEVWTKRQKEMVDRRTKNGNVEPH